ncbi:hypothetical protein M422DRAFT_36067, partial [Sphaerobolus stellatus SS14]
MAGGSRRIEARWLYSYRSAYCIGLLCFHGNLCGSSAASPSPMTGIVCRKPPKEEEMDAVLQQQDNYGRLGTTFLLIWTCQMWILLSLAVLSGSMIDLLQ